MNPVQSEKVQEEDELLVMGDGDPEPIDPNILDLLKRSFAQVLTRELRNDGSWHLALLKVIPYRHTRQSLREGERTGGASGGDCCYTSLTKGDSKVAICMSCPSCILDIFNEI